MSENRYDKHDMVRQEGVLRAGPLKAGCYRVRDPETLEWSSRQFHLMFDNTVLAVMGEEAAKLFTRFVSQALDGRPHAAGPEVSE